PVGGQLAHPGGAQQRPHGAFVPLVGAADAVGDDEVGGAEAVPVQHRQGGVEHAGVAVVEGEPDQAAGLAPGHGADELADADPAQAAAGQPGHLLGEPGRGHRELVWVVGDVGHGVVHEDHRRVAQGYSRRDAVLVLEVVVLGVVVLGVVWGGGGVGVGGVGGGGVGGGGVGGGGVVVGGAVVLGGPVSGTGGDPA